MHNKFFFDDILKNDKLDFEANPGIEQRIMYHYQLKSASSKIKKNQIIPFFDSLFNSKYVGIKIGLAGLLVVLAFGLKQINAPKEISIQTDTVAAINIHDTVKYNANDLDSVY